MTLDRSVMLVTTLRPILSQKKTQLPLGLLLAAVYHRINSINRADTASHTRMYECVFLCQHACGCAFTAFMLVLTCLHDVSVSCQYLFF